MNQWCVAWSQSRNSLQALPLQRALAGAAEDYRGDIADDWRVMLIGDERDMLAAAKLSGHTIAARTRCRAAAAQAIEQARK